MSFSISPPEGPLAESALDAVPSRVFLDLADITSSDTPGVTYGVYVNVPDGDPAPDDEYYVGNAAFFGIETLGRLDSEHAGIRLSNPATSASGVSACSCNDPLPR